MLVLVFFWCVFFCVFFLFCFFVFLFFGGGDGDGRVVGECGCMNNSKICTPIDTLRSTLCPCIHFIIIIPTLPLHPHPSSSSPPFLFPKGTFTTPLPLPTQVPIIKCSLTVSPTKGAPPVTVAVDISLGVANGSDAVLFVARQLQVRVGVCWCVFFSVYVCL